MHQRIPTAAPPSPRTAVRSDPSPTPVATTAEPSPGLGHSLRQVAVEGPVQRGPESPSTVQLQPGLEDLPNELLDNILGSLPDQDVRNAREVNTRLAGVGRGVLERRGQFGMPVPGANEPQEDPATSILSTAPPQPSALDQFLGGGGASSPEPSSGSESDSEGDLASVGEDAEELLPFALDL